MGLGFVAPSSLPPIENTKLLRAAHRRRHHPRRPSHSVLLTGLWVVEESSTWDRPADFVPSPWPSTWSTIWRAGNRPGRHTSHARSPHPTPLPNRLWWQSRSALDEALARAAPLPSLPCAWESASIMRRDSQTSCLRRSGLTLSLSSQLLMISSRDEV